MTLKASDLADTVRRECGIHIDDTNRGRGFFDKEELLYLLAGLTAQRHTMEDKVLKIFATIHKGVAPQDLNT